MSWCLSMRKSRRASERMPKRRPCLTRRGLAVRQGQNLRGKVTAPRNRAQRLCNRGHLRVAESHGASVAIGKMDVADFITGCAESLAERNFLDIHVEKIGEETGLGELQFVDQRADIGETIA